MPRPQNASLVPLANANAPFLLATIFVAAAQRAFAEMTVTKDEDHKAAEKRWERIRDAGKPVVASTPKSLPGIKAGALATSAVGTVGMYVGWIGYVSGATDSGHSWPVPVGVAGAVTTTAAGTLFALPPYIIKKQAAASSEEWMGMLTTQVAAALGPDSELDSEDVANWLVELASFSLCPELFTL